MKSLKLTVLAARRLGFSRRLGGYFATKLWFTPWRFPRSSRTLERESEWLRGAEHYFIAAGSHHLAATAMGSGPVVLVVHGWGERAASMGALLRPIADAGFRAVAIDLPGHGSTSRGATDAIVLAGAIRAAASTLDAEFVVAHSLGATATIVALRDGLAAKGVALLAPAVRLEHGVEHFSKMFALPRKSIEGLRDEIERRFGPSVWRDLAADRIATGFSVPALIVHDEQDPQVPMSDAIALESAWGVAHLERTDGLGHMKVLSDPAVAAKITGFLVSVSLDERRSATGS